VTHFDPAQYGTAAAALMDNMTACELGPGTPNRAVYDTLCELNVESLFAGNPVRNLEMARCCVSALWLLHNYLDESHRISQSIPTVSGSYWHGIMHRREPDFSNAKYWFRRVGDHPVFPSLLATARKIADHFPEDPFSRQLAEQTQWDPFQFVDQCEAARRDSASDSLGREIAFAEWRLLFDYCYREALSRGRRV
jgi:hypothetical protein